VISTNPDFIRRRKGLCNQFRCEMQTFQARVTALSKPEEFTDERIIKDSGFPPSDTHHLGEGGGHWLKECIDKMVAIKQELAVLNHVRFYEVLERERQGRINLLTTLAARP
jgi:hypothetical protein